MKQRKILMHIVAIFSLYLTTKYCTFENGAVLHDCTGIQSVQLICISYSILMTFELIKLPEMKLMQGGHGAVDFIVFWCYSFWIVF